MKLNLTFAIAILAMAPGLNAANYVASNVATGTSADVLIQNTNGMLNTGGIVAIGYFAGSAPSSSLSEISNTIAGFSVQTFALVGSYSADLGAGYAGYYQGDVFNGAILNAGDPLIGKGVYLFAGNNATLNGSTSWALVQVGTFIPDNPPLINQYSANATAALLPTSIVFGKLGTADNSVAGTLGTTLQLAAVPEPSAALLGTLGALGLLRRRRA